MPEWQKRHTYTKPTNDNDYFERMSRVIFMSGLNWRTLEGKWPGIKQAFADFDIHKVADLEETDVEKLMKNSNIIRNEAKIRAVISNAGEFQKAATEFGSFSKYLDSLRKSGEESMRKAIEKRFGFMGKGTTVIFLFSVGEDLPQAAREMEAKRRR